MSFPQIIVSCSAREAHLNIRERLSSVINSYSYYFCSERLVQIVEQEFRLDKRRKLGHVENFLTCVLRQMITKNFRS